MLDYKKLSKSFSDAIKRLTPEDIERYFPEDTTPKGWVSIEDSLPKWFAKDVRQGYSKFKVKYQDGTEGITYVSDHNIWYYRAKEENITHWLNE